MKKRDNTPGITSKCTTILHQLLQKYEESSKNSTIDESAALKIQEMLGVKVSDGKCFRPPSEKSDTGKEAKTKNDKSDKIKKTPEDEFVLIKPTWKFDPKKLTEHQKEVITRRRENIPALYEDLSQSQDDYSLKTWKPAGYEGVSDSSKSHNHDENAAVLKDSKKVNENQVDKTPTREKVEDISVKKVLRNIPNPGLMESPKELNSLQMIENLKDKNLKPKNICPVITDANIENIDIKHSPHIERSIKKSSLSARLEKSLKKLHEGTQEGISSPPAPSSPSLAESERPLRTRRKPNKYDPDDSRFISSPKASTSSIDDRTPFLSPRSINADAPQHMGDMQDSPKVSERALPQITPTKIRKQKTRLMKELEIDTVEGHPSIEILNGSRKPRRRNSVEEPGHTKKPTTNSMRKRRMSAGVKTPDDKIDVVSEISISPVHSKKTVENTIKRRRISAAIKTPDDKIDVSVISTESISNCEVNPPKSIKCPEEVHHAHTEVPLKGNTTVSTTIKDNFSLTIVVSSDEEYDNPPPESEDVIASSQDSSVSSIKTPRRISAVINGKGKNIKITKISSPQTVNPTPIDVKETEEIISKSLPVSIIADESNAPLIKTPKKFQPSVTPATSKDDIIVISSERISQMDTPSAETDNSIKTKKPRRASTGSKSNALEGIQIHEAITEISTNAKSDFSNNSLKSMLRRISTECSKELPSVAPIEVEDLDEIQSTSSTPTLEMDTSGKADISIPTESTNIMSSRDLGGTTSLSCQTLTLMDTLPIIKSNEPVKLSVKVAKRLSNVFKDISSKTSNSLSMEKNENTEQTQNSFEAISVINFNSQVSTTNEVENPPKINTETLKITSNTTIEEINQCGDRMSSETITKMDTLPVVSAGDSSTPKIKLFGKKTSITGKLSVPIKRIGLIKSLMDKSPVEELQQNFVTPDSESSLNTGDKVEIKSISFADLSTQQIAEADTEPVEELVYQNEKISVESVVVPSPIENGVDNAPSNVGSVSSDLIVLSDDDECARSAANILSSPHKHDLDDRNTELLNSTIDISPIKNVSFGEETTNIEDETCPVIPDLSSPEKNDCVSECVSKPSSPEIFSVEQVSPDKDKREDIRENSNSPSPPRPVPAVSSPSSMLDQKKNRPIMSRANGRTAQMLGLCKLDLEQIESADKTDNMSPIRAVTRKNLHNFYGNGSESSDRSKINEEENILEFSKVLPSQNASPAGPILKRLMGDDQTYSPSPSSKVSVLISSWLVLQCLYSAKHYLLFILSEKTSQFP